MVLRGLVLLYPLLPLDTTVFGHFSDRGAVSRLMVEWRVWSRGV